MKIIKLAASYQIVMYTTIIIKISFIISLYYRYCNIQGMLLCIFVFFCLSLCMNFIITITKMFNIMLNYNSINYNDCYIPILKYYNYNNKKIKL